MQQRFAFALLIRLDQSPTEIGPITETFHGTVQAADAPTDKPEVSHFRSLRQLKRWLEDVLPPHDSPQPMRIEATVTTHHSHQA